MLFHGMISAMMYMVTMIGANLVKINEVCIFLDDFFHSFYKKLANLTFAACWNLFHNEAPFMTDRQNLPLTVNICMCRTCLCQAAIR